MLYQSGSILLLALALIFWLKHWILSVCSLMYLRVMTSLWRIIRDMLKLLLILLLQFRVQFLDLELIQFTTSPDYHSFVTTYSMLSGSHNFDDLRSKLIFYEQQLKF